MAVTSVLICTDQAPVQEGLARMLRGALGTQMVELVEPDALMKRFLLSGRDCLVLVGTHRGKVATELIAKVLTVDPSAKVVAVGNPDQEAIATAVAAGARSFVPWNAVGTCVFATLAHAVVHDAPEPPSSTGEVVVRDSFELSERELMVLCGMSQGLTNGEIARSLSVTVPTVKTYAQRLFVKFGVRDRAGAVAYGFRNSLLT